MAKMKDGIYCAKCHVEMKLGIVPEYEFTSGFPIYNMPAYLCHKCDNVFFTEEQADDLESKTKERIKRSFGFDRKVAVSGKSLAIGIPSELARHLHLKKGQKLRLTPVSDNAFLIRKA